MLRYTGSAGENNWMDFQRGGPNEPVRVVGYENVGTLVGCTQTSFAGGESDLVFAANYTCPDVASVVADGGDGDDHLGVNGLNVPATVIGGAGDDRLSGGETPATLSGGAGDDEVSGRRADTLSGGSGIDLVGYTATGAFGATLGADVPADFENVRVWSPQPVPVTLTGDERPNELTTREGDDVLTGGAGADRLESAEGDDRLEARDGFPDRVACGPGTDVANADLYDQVGGDCERANVVHVPAASEDGAPRVELVVPRPARVRAVARLRARASDDNGVRRVRFLVDGREACTDRRAPFTCDVRPRRTGRRTLVAIAVDAAHQTATAVRTLRVARARRSDVALQPAPAASLVNENGTLTFTASPGWDNAVYVASDAATPSTVWVDPNSDRPATLRGCTPREAGYLCDAVTSVVVDTGSGGDVIGAARLRQPLTAFGGEGDDTIGGGEAADRLDGGAGDDRLAPGAGDVVNGGSGTDRVQYRAPTPGTPVSLTLDGTPQPGEPVDVAADVEDVAVTGGLNTTTGPVTLVGNARANDLPGSPGNDALTGGAGADTLRGEDGDDRLDLRDGFTDRAYCGRGTDRVLADQHDQVGDSCEVVDVRPTAKAFDDAPPTLRWNAPRLRARRAATLEVTATDDFGVTRVRFLAGSRTLCTDTEAPFSCEYRPRTAGRATLIAIASDGAGQTTSAIRAVNVPRRG